MFTMPEGVKFSTKKFKHFADKRLQMFIQIIIGLYVIYLGHSKHFKFIENL